MKRLFFFLLRRYTKSEKDRIEVFASLQESVSKTYNEQNSFGNLYNSHIEFIMSCPLVIKLVKEKRVKDIEMVKSGLADSYDRSIEFIKKEK